MAEDDIVDEMKKLVVSDHSKVDFELYIENRNRVYELCRVEYQNCLEKRKRVDIKIEVGDGRVVRGVAWETTPFRVAKELGNVDLKEIIVSRVNGVLYDISRPIEEDCVLTFLTIEDKEAREVFWHSSAHLLGEVCEEYFGCLLCKGPPIEKGFYYDMMNIGGRSVTSEDLVHIEKLYEGVIGKKSQIFERTEVTKERLIEMFKHNPYKLYFIRNNVADGESSTIYKCGSLIDFCKGPHISQSSIIKACKMLKVSSSYFRGDSERDSLQRIYGITFRTKQELTKYIEFQQHAEKNDHRKLGKKLQYYMFHELSPGSCFFLPYGTIIYNKLLDFIREEYRRRGFSEVITPNVYNVNLWKTSGHWDNYRENMFIFENEKELYGIKPMNCPGHCLMFSSKERSYRDLPIRFADFGVLHRNELSGTLTGLTRVRRFQQDDAHIFCRMDQLEEEISGCIDFLNHVYSTFGFKYTFKLSTRPNAFIGDIKCWEEAEKELEKALNRSNTKWELNKGDGAFYGPKIDVVLMDAQERLHQCGTIQLDFQLPIKFGLKYQDVKDKKPCISTPIIIHRAIFGSVERMMAILMETFSGHLPFWLSPRQVIIIPVSHAFNQYAKHICDVLQGEGFYSEVDISENMLDKKIFNAVDAAAKVVVVVGDKEMKAQTVNVREASVSRKNLVLGIDNFVGQLKQLRDSRSLDCILYEEKE